MLRYMKHCGAESLDICQGGFREKRGALEQIVALQECVLAAKSRQKKPRVVYLDIKGAYDSVCRPLLWRKMRRAGFEPASLRLLELLFNRTECAVMLHGKRSRWFRCESGV